MKLKIALYLKWIATAVTLIGAVFASLGLIGNEFFGPV